MRESGDRDPVHRRAGGGAEPRAAGREARLRPARRRGDPAVRRPGRLVHPSRADPARAGRHPHGGRIRPGLRRARGRPRHLGTRGDEHHHRNLHRADGLGAHGGHHRPAGGRQPGPRLVPGGRRLGHRASRREALLPREERGRHSAGDPRGVPPLPHGPARARPDRRAEGLRGRDHRLERRRAAAPAGLPRARRDRPVRGGEGGDAPRRGEAARAARGSRRGHLGRGGRGARARRAASDPGGEHAARQGRVPRDAPAQPRDAGHARHRLRQQGRGGLRPDHVDRLPVGRPYHPRPRAVLHGRGEDPRGHRPLGDRQGLRRRLRHRRRRSGRDRGPRAGRRPRRHRGLAVARGGVARRVPASLRAEGRPEGAGGHRRAVPPDAADGRWW